MIRKLFIFCLSLSVMATSVYSDIESDLYGHWSLDGSLDDQSGNGLYLVTAGSAGPPVVNAQGRFGSCYEFNNSADGTQVLFKGPLSIDATDAVTITAWVKPYELISGFSTTSPHTIAKFYSSTVGTVSFDIRIRDGKLDVYFTNPNSNNISSFNIPVDQWSFVAVTQSDTFLTVYVNEQKQTFMVNGGQAYDRLILGSTSANTPRGLKGLIDEVRLYKRALTDEDVQQVYEYDPTISDITTGLYGHWPLDGDVADISGNGLNLTVVGTAPTYNENGTIDGCYQFDNLNSGPSMLAAMTTAVDPNDSITITGWINPSVLQDGFSATSPHIIVRMYNSPTSTNIMDLRIRDGKLDCYYTNPSLNISSGLAVPTNEWTFIALIQDKATLKFYMNDQFSSEFAVDGGQSYNRFTIGSAPGTSRGLTGLLDDLRVYKRALSASDLQAVYNYTTPDPDIANDMISYWHLDQDLSDAGPSAMPLVASEINNGDPNAMEEGYLGGCYKFDNVNKGPQVLLAEDFYIGPEDGLTITGWVNPSELHNGFTDVSPHYLAFLSYYDDQIDDTTFHIVLRIYDGKLAGYSNNPAANNVTSLAVPLNQWSFMALTQVGKTLTVYLNGEHQSFTVDGGAEYNNLVIGGNNSTELHSKRGLTGFLDEIRLYRRALTSEEIDMIHQLQYRESDINQDGIVDIGDFAIVGDSWLTEVDTGIVGDINFDGIVNPSDLSIMVKYWLETTE